MSTDLAIVIPVYKKEYLTAAVQSIQHQTNQRFTAYICDDASPYDLESVINKLHLPENFLYHRFSVNAGQKSLATQWGRCVEQTKGEKWIWLFSDDDIADKNCVAAFYEAKKNNTGYDVYRFNTNKIDESGNLIKENVFPRHVSSAGFLNIKLNYLQESYIVESIFSREAFNRIGGFPDLPLAWAADDMLWTKIASDTGIFTIQSARVSWRYSGLNISSRKENKTGIIKLKASRQFIRWIYSKPQLLSKLDAKDLPVKWYIRQLKNLRKEMSLFEQLSAVTKVSRFSMCGWYYYFQMLKNESKIIGWLKKF